MTLPLFDDLGDAVRAASGLAVLALGLAVLAVDWTHHLNRMLALYAVPAGAGQVLANMSATSALRIAAGATMMVAAVGLVLLAVRFPRPLRGDERRALVLPGLAALASLAVGLPLTSGGGASELSVEVNRAFFWSARVLIAAFWFLLFTLVERDRRAPDPRHGVMTAALALWPGLLAGLTALGGFNPTVQPRLVGYAEIGLTLALAGMWLAAAAREHSRAKAARNVALVVAVAPLVGMLLSLGGVGNFGTGIARTLGVLVLGYAIVRHQLLGIDVKVRWTISKSTIAAAFVAAFFLASEGAQILFGAGNEWVGLLAAGALVFALAPLQRAAERLAEKAVPVADATAALPARQDHDETFRVAARKFLRDGTLSRDEERHLARLAANLGLDPERATAIRHAVEDEAHATGGRARP